MSSISSRILNSGGVEDFVFSKENERIGLTHLDKYGEELYRNYLTTYTINKEDFEIFNNIEGIYRLVGYAFRKVLKVEDVDTATVFYEDNTNSPEVFEYSLVQATRKIK